MTTVARTLGLGLAGGALLALLAVAAQGYGAVWTTVLLTGLPFCK